MQETASNIYHQIKKLATELGFATVGYAALSPLAEDIEQYTKSMERGYFADLNYLKRNIDKRENPSLLVDGAKSILVFLAPYGTNRQKSEDEYVNICIGNTNASNPSALSPAARYKVAQYALGDDYHSVIKQKLSAVLDKMKELDSNINGRVFTDTAPVMERAWAVKAGLGFIGKNNFFISRECGIRNFIGVIISNFEIDNRTTQEEICDKATENATNLSGYGKKYCGNCTKCIEACPTGALCAPYSLDARRCISYLTIERKEASFELNMQEANERDGWIFGCDACLNACPWNSRNMPGWSEFEQCADPLPSSHLRRR